MKATATPQKFKILNGKHLTATDRRLIQASIENDLQPVRTKYKTATIEKTGEAHTVILSSFENGVGIGAPRSWRTSNILIQIL